LIRGGSRNWRDYDFSATGRNADGAGTATRPFPGISIDIQAESRKSVPEGEAVIEAAHEKHQNLR